MGIKLRKISEFNSSSIYEVELKSDSGSVVSILNYGALVKDWKVPVAQGLQSVVVGLPTFDDYLNDNAYLGAIIGRVANRIENSQFIVGEKAYNVSPTVGTDHLHGGPTGISKKVWSIEEDSVSNAVRLSCLSPDGEGGYPGAVEFSVIYQLSGASLKIEMRAKVSELTPINMVQHNYFNLSGEEDIRNHELKIKASHYTPLSEALIPTGDILPVDDTKYDFRKFKSFNSIDMGVEPYDINFILPTARDKAEPVAYLRSNKSGLNLSLWTDQPGLQLYNSEHLSHKKFGGICLEDQQFPAAVNRPSFPSILVAPDKDYLHRCEIKITS